MDRSIILDVRIAKDTHSPLVPLTIAHLVPNRGIEGDRYYFNVGSFPTGEVPAYDVSLIKEDMYQKLVLESLHTGNVKALRRNIVVSGCSLAMLIEQPFQIGMTLFRGLMPRRLSHLPLEQLAGKRLSSGTGAHVLSEGIICLGDEVCRVNALATL
jgi:hypothetical protein